MLALVVVELCWMLYQRQLHYCNGLGFLVGDVLGCVVLIGRLCHSESFEIEEVMTSSSHL